MTPEGERLVRDTWQQFVLSAARHSLTFVDRLAELDPAALQTFERAGYGEGGRLMQMIGALIASVDEPERFVRTLVALGRRQAEHGVRVGDYEAAGAALLWTLESALGPDWTDEVGHAWREGCHAMTAVLRRVAAARPDPGRTTGGGLKKERGRNERPGPWSF